MKSTISVATFLLLFSIVPIASFATDYYKATKRLNVRTGPGTGYSISFTLQKGDEVEILSKDGGWYKVNYLGKIGYAHSTYLESASAANPGTSEQAETDNSAFGILGILCVIGFIWFLPILMIIGSDRTTSSEKIAWILGIIFISWFAWIFYMLLAPIKKKD